MIDKKLRISVFQLLEIPLRDTYRTDGFFGIMSDNPDSSNLRDRLILWLDELNQDEENEVKAIVTAFDRIKYKTVHVKTDTVELSFDKERNQLKKQLLILIPFEVSSDAIQDGEFYVG